MSQETMGSNSEAAEQSVDGLIEAALGFSLSEKQRLSKVQEEKLLKRIREAPEDARDEPAELEYLSYRGRTIYSAVRDTPETTGLTFEDYFQIGCEVVLTEARGNELAETDYETTTYLNNKIKGAIKQASGEMNFGSSTPQDRDATEEKTMLFPGQLVRPGFGRLIDPYRETERTIAIDTIDEVLKWKLPERSAKIMRLRFGLGEDGVDYTLEETARHFNLTSERIRQIQNSSTKRLSEIAPELDFSEHGTDQQVEERTPFVIPADIHEQRVARRLGYKAAELSTVDDIEVLKSGRVSSSRYKVSKIIAKIIEENKPWHFSSISDIEGTRAEIGVAKKVISQINNRGRTLQEIWSRASSGGQD